jgi:hypothetical protein
MIPVSLAEQLVPGTLEFAIQTLVEDRMDMAVFEDRYQNDEGRQGRASQASKPIRDRWERLGKRG